jgi:hypothetical protein
MATKAECLKHGRPTNSHKLFEDYFRSRSDIGFIKMLLDVALEPRDPFKPWERRRWKKGFVGALLFVLTALGWFGYFSLVK